MCQVQNNKRSETYVVQHRV